MQKVISYCQCSDRECTFVVVSPLRRSPRQFAQQLPLRLLSPPRPRVTPYASCGRYTTMRFTALGWSANHAASASTPSGVFLQHVIITSYSFDNTDHQWNSPVCQSIGFAAVCLSHREDEAICVLAPVESGKTSPGAATPRRRTGCTGIALQWTLRRMNCQPQRLYYTVKSPSAWYASRASSLPKKNGNKHLHVQMFFEGICMLLNVSLSPTDFGHMQICWCTLALASPSSLAAASSAAAATEQPSAPLTLTAIPQHVATQRTGMLSVLSFIQQFLPEELIPLYSYMCNSL